MKRIRAVLLALGWTTLGILVLARMGDVDPTHWLSQPITAAIATLSAFAANKALGLGLFSHTSMALLSYAAFHLAEVVPAQIGLFLPQFNEPGRAGFPIAVQCYLLFVVGVGLGTSLGFIFFNRGRRSAPTGLTRSSDSWLWLTGTSLALVGTILLLVGVAKFGPASVWHASYGETFRMQAELDPRFFVTAFWALPSSLLIMLVAATTRAQLRIVVGLGASFFVLANYLGYRGAAFTMMMAAAVVAVKRKIVRRPLYLFGIGLVLVLIVVPLVRRMRMLPASQRLSPSAIVHSVREFSMWDGLSELGGTFRMLVLACELFPTQSEWWWGASYWQALSRVVPNLSPNWRGSYFDVTRQMRLGEYLTYKIEPHTWRSYGGLGSSGIAEPYVNFGAAAIPVHFTLLFLLLSWFDWAGEPISRERLAAGALVLMLVCWSARDDLYSVIRGAAWGFAVLLGGKHLFARYDGARASSTRLGVGVGDASRRWRYRSCRPMQS